MSTVYKAPLMNIRKDHEDPKVSFGTTEQISATKYALREYMRHHHNGRPFTEGELDMLKFRHRNPTSQEADTLTDGVNDPWGAAWSISYVREEDRLQGDKTQEITQAKKPHYVYTLYGYCSHLPVA